MEIAQSRREYETSRLEMMRGYAETTACRRSLLLTYFGETFDRTCGHCDNCRAGTAHQVRHDAEDSPFPVGAAVEHREFGTGTVIRYEGDRIVVLFDEAGYRTLGLPAVLNHHLLTMSAP